MSKKILALVSVLAFATTGVSAYEEIECSSNAVFSENSCNQCFDGGSKVQGDNLGLLSDLWVNVTDVPKILYKEAQKEPEMINLNSSNVEWSQTPGKEGFWDYTEEFNALYSEDDEGYVLKPGKSVKWIESSLASAYKLDKNTATKGANIGLLVYPISTHVILEDGLPEVDGNEHNECVLFKSGDKAAKKVVTPPKKLPETGPSEFLMLLILAMILGFGLLKYKSRA